MSDDEPSSKRCAGCAQMIPAEDVKGTPFERCSECVEPEHVNAFLIARKFPRVLRAVQAHVQSDNRALATRYVRKALAGEKLYMRIVREAFSRRHDERKQRMR
ncbi:MAG: hypothetical protein IT381_21195 [Deltaproteobacteria bacterium]|nr:hypothetical protein [Deltaproteobacteria bacterium]